MSRYANLSPLALSVMAIIQPRSSMRPISQADLLAQTRTIAPPDEIHDAVEQLLDAALISHMRHTRDGVTQNVYWPTGLKPITAPSMEEIRMASEPKNSLLNRLILLHGPIAGAALAEKARATGANIPAKNVPGLLETLVRKGEVIVKIRAGASHYMTPNQAADWDAAHVLTSDDVQSPDAKQSGGEIHANETATESAAYTQADARIRSLEVDIAHRDRVIHDLKNDVFGAHLVLNQLAQRLQVDAFDQIPGVIDEIMQATASRALHADPLPGKQALVFIDSADLIEIEELAVDDDAQNMALASIELGHAARVLVVRIMGEAKRQAEWKAAA